MNIAINRLEKSAMKYELKHRHVNMRIPIMYPFGNEEGYYWIKEAIDDDWFVAYYTPLNGGEWSYPGLDDPVSVKEGRTIIIGPRLKEPTSYDGMLVRPDLHEELRNSPEEQERIRKINDIKEIRNDLEDLLK